MTHTINRQLINVNWGLIARRRVLRHIQPMVEGETLALRIKTLSTREGCSQKKLAEWAGVTPQAVTKWIKDGNIADNLLRKVAAGAGESYFDLKYGKEWRAAIAAATGDEPPTDIDRNEALQVFDSLPPRYQEVWVALGHSMVVRYGPKGAGNPYPQVLPPKARQPAKVKR